MTVVVMPFAMATAGGGGLGSTVFIAAADARYEPDQQAREEKETRTIEMA